MTQLENNTTALEAILATVNALPNAGSGGESGSSGNPLDAFMPTNLGITSGTYTPTTSGTNVLQNIRVGTSYTSAATTGTYPVLMFALVRKDGGYNATGSSNGRNIVAYTGMKGCGAVSYRNNSTSSITNGAGTETVSSATYNYGVGGIGATSRTNAFFRQMDTKEPIVVFSTYGIITLEANKEYTWIAIYDKTLMVA